MPSGGRPSLCVQPWSHSVLPPVPLHCLPGRHTSRFLLCYILVGLPLLMWPLTSWGAPVLAVVIALLVLGIEEISAFIEEPFRVRAKLHSFSYSCFTCYTV